MPFADVGPLKIADGLPDERCCSCPTSSRPATWAPRCATSRPGDVIAVWGAGPVGQFAIASARMLGAERVIAIDAFDYRLRHGPAKAGATEAINYEEQPDVLEALKEMTGGRGPDACIDAVGMEAHTATGRCTPTTG